MKKMLFLVVFIFIALALTAQTDASKKTYKLQRAYAYVEESLLISDMDLSCSYFIRDDLPEDILIIDSYQTERGRRSFLNDDNMFISKGSNDGLKVGDVLVIISRGERIRGLGRYYQKKSLAEIINIYENRSLVRLKNGCHPVHIGDFAIPFQPDSTVFARKFDYMTARFPENPISGDIVYKDLTMGSEAFMASMNQLVTIDLGKGVVDKGSLLLVYRILKNDLPPLIIGSAIVIHAENTNSTVKILDSSTDIIENDKVLLLPAGFDKDAAGTDKNENIPIVDTLKAEAQGKEDAQAEAGAVTEPNGNALVVDVFFDFDSKQPRGDHDSDFTAIKEFIAAKSEYLVTLRGYTCSIGGEEYNLRLAKDRVDVIKNILISQYGVDDTHVEAFFYGEKEPPFDNSSEMERLKNRLVRIEVSGK